MVEGSQWNSPRMDQTRGHTCSKHGLVINYATSSDDRPTWLKAFFMRNKQFIHNVVFQMIATASGVS